MAVDIKSLRIGSHVLWNGERRRVDAITEYSIAFRIADSERKEYDSATIEQIEPIAITPELLKELGLNVINHGCSEHWFLGNFDLTHNADSRYWDYDGNIRVEFLHELEDLYYLKYGVELIPD